MASVPYGSSVYQFRCGWVCPLCLSSSEGVVSGHQSSVPVSHIKGSIASVLVKEARPLHQFLNVEGVTLVLSVALMVDVSTLLSVSSVSQ